MERQTRRTFLSALKLAGAVLLFLGYGIEAVVHFLELLTPSQHEPPRHYTLTAEPGRYTIAWQTPKGLVIQPGFVSAGTNVGQPSVGIG